MSKLAVTVDSCEVFQEKNKYCREGVYPTGEENSMEGVTHENSLFRMSQLVQEMPQLTQSGVTVSG